MTLNRLPAQGLCSDKGTEFFFEAMRASLNKCTIGFLQHVFDPLEGLKAQLTQLHACLWPTLVTLLKT